jgi:hypothetical protein
MVSVAQVIEEIAKQHSDFGKNVTHEAEAPSHFASVFWFYEICGESHG